MDLYIDADSIIYRAAHLSGKNDDALTEALAIVDDDSEEVALIEADIDEENYLAKKVFHSMVAEIIGAVEEDGVAKEYLIDKIVLVVTVKPSLSICSDLENNFRYGIMDSVADPAVKGYKANREGMAVPDGLNELYEYVYDLPQTICIGGVEADDVVVHFGRAGHMVAALDKDVLGSLNYAYNFGKKEWVENTPLEVLQFPFIQTITGDTSDGLRGVYRVGIKGAKKALQDITDVRELWRQVMLQYADKEQSRDEAIATMRCVRMDQWTPRGGLNLWNPIK